MTDRDIFEENPLRRRRDDDLIPIPIGLSPIPVDPSDTFWPITTDTSTSTNRRHGSSASSKRKCFGQNLETKHGSSKQDNPNEDINSLDAILINHNGASAFRTITDYHGGTASDHKPNTQPLFDEQAFFPWNGVPRSTAGKTGQEIFDIIFAGSAHTPGWPLGGPDLWIELGGPYSGSAPNKDVEWWNYRMLSHLRFVCGYNPVVLHPRDHYLRAFWVMKWFFESYGLDTIDPAAPTDGVVDASQIPDCAAQALLGLDPVDYPECITPMGNWVMVQFDATQYIYGWWYLMAHAIGQIALRNDLVFNQLMSAGSVGTCWLNRNDTHFVFFNYCP